jgi:hypothetical protein
MPDSSMPDIGFSHIPPLDCGFDIDDPQLEANELPFRDMACCLTAAFFLHDQDLPFDDLVARFNVKPESAHALIVEKLPTHCWWQCLLSRAREVASASDNEREMADWALLGNFAMGFYGLHMALEDYPMPIGDMLVHYVNHARGQKTLLDRGGIPRVQAVANDDVNAFLKHYAKFEAALERRKASMEGIMEDGAINRSAFILTGDAGKAFQATWSNRYDD